jgi:hypothetical protein
MRLAKAVERGLKIATGLRAAEALGEDLDPAVREARKDTGRPGEPALEIDEIDE